MALLMKANAKKRESPSSQSKDEKAPISSGVRLRCPRGWLRVGDNFVIYHIAWVGIMNVEEWWWEHNTSAEIKNHQRQSSVCWICGYYSVIIYKVYAAEWVGRWRGVPGTSVTPSDYPHVMSVICPPSGWSPMHELIALHRFTCSFYQSTKLLLLIHLIASDRA